MLALFDDIHQLEANCTLMEVAKEYRFTRINNHNTNYPELNWKHIGAKKFDLFDGDVQVGMLLTNNYNTEAVTHSGDRFAIKVNSSWSHRWQATIRKNNQENFASILCTQSFLFGLVGTDAKSITFSSSNASFHLFRRKKKESNYPGMSGYHFDFIQNDLVKCSIVNLKKQPVISFPNDTELGGIVLSDHNISILQILCFLQFVNIAIDLDHDL